MEAWAWASSLPQLDDLVQERLQKHLDKLDEGLGSRDAAKGRQPPPTLSPSSFSSRR